MNIIAHQAVSADQTPNRSHPHPGLNDADQAAFRHLAEAANDPRTEDPVLGLWNLYKTAEATLCKFEKGPDAHNKEVGPEEKQAWRRMEELELLICEATATTLVGVARQSKLAANLADFERFKDGRDEKLSRNMRDALLRLSSLSSISATPTAGPDPVFAVIAEYDDALAAFNAADESSMPAPEYAAVEKRLNDTAIAVTEVRALTASGMVAKIDFLEKEFSEYDYLRVAWKTLKTDAMALTNSHAQANPPAVLPVGPDPALAAVAAARKAVAAFKATPSTTEFEATDEFREIEAAMHNAESVLADAPIHTPAGLAAKAAYLAKYTLADDPKAEGFVTRMSSTIDAYLNGAGGQVQLAAVQEPVSSNEGAIAILFRNWEKQRGEIAEVYIEAASLDPTVPKEYRGRIEVDVRPDGKDSDELAAWWESGLGALHERLKVAEFRTDAIEQEMLFLGSTTAGDIVAKTIVSIYYSGAGPECDPEKEDNPEGGYTDRFSASVLRDAHRLGLIKAPPRMYSGVRHELWEDELEEYLKTA